MSTYALDLTGANGANLIVNEQHDVSVRNDRIFIPNAGAFFGKGLIIRDLATNRVLAPLTDYRVLHLVREAVIASNKEVYAVIMITDPGVLDVKLQYQAIGGDYQNIASNLNQLLDEYRDGRTPTDTIGQIVGAPIQVPPQHHIQNIRDFESMGSAIQVLEGIRQALLGGDTNAFGSVYEYIDIAFNEAKVSVNETKTHFTNIINQTEQKFVRKNDSIIITDDDANPSSYTDGVWKRLRNMFLFGTTDNGQVGQVIDVAAGYGMQARKTNIWVRDDSYDFIERIIFSDKNTVNEGESVTFTLVTTGIASGTSIGYTLSGISNPEDTNTPLTGNFVVNGSGLATLTVNLKQDSLTEGDEILKCALTSFPTIYSKVVVNDTSKTPEVELYFSSDNQGNNRITQVNEGGECYLIFKSKNIIQHSTIQANLVTGQNMVTTDDFSNGAGNVVWNTVTNGFASAKIFIKEDHITEGNEIYSVAANGGDSVTGWTFSNLTASITVIDTSLTPVYSSWFSTTPNNLTQVASSVNEGQVVYLCIKIVNPNPGDFDNLSKAPLVWSGVAFEADTVPNYSDYGGKGLPSTYSYINNNTSVTGNTPNSWGVALPINIKEDYLTEGDEVLTVNVRTTSGENKSISTITINDTSKTPTYSLRFSMSSNGATITSCNEGDVVYGIIETTNVPNGTVLTLNRTGVSNTDFEIEPPVNVVINGNLGTFSFKIKNDFTTEGTEVLSMTVLANGVGVTNASLSIADTSVSMSGAITFSTTTLVSDAVTQVNEDAGKIYIIFSTTDVPNNSVCGVAFTGQNATGITANFPSYVTIVNNEAVLDFTTVADWLTEGDQTITATLLLPTGMVITNSLVIKDTSRTPIFSSFYYSSLANGSDTITQANEGDSVYLIGVTENIPDGTSLPISYSGTSNANDFNGTRPTAITVNGNKFSISYSIKNDFTSEGNETLIATITLPNNTTRAATLNIIDTSILQTVDLVYNTLSNGSGSNVISVNEGQTVYAIITTTGVPDNTAVTLAWSGNSDQVNTPKPTSVSVVGNKAVLTITATDDHIREDSAQVVKLTVTTPSGATTNNDLTINDTSKGYAVANWRTSTSTASAEVPTTGVNEGQTVYLHVTTSGIPANETLSLEYSGTGINDADFTAKPATMATSSSKGYAAIGFALDYVTENTETLNVTIKDSKGNVLVTTSIIILDYSLTPTFTAVFATNSSGTNTFTSIDEPTSGSTNMYAVVKTTNMFNGDIVTLTFSGTANNNDFDGTPITGNINVTINNNIGYYLLKLKADNAVG
ncbi:MAG: hypothetical protein E6R13_05610 [Spirochaetes bacterium]|nr:MAG: hypothetical protein E6R13_05610 [Spirochaetota bacterium]